MLCIVALWLKDTSHGPRHKHLPSKNVIGPAQKIPCPHLSNYGWLHACITHTHTHILQFSMTLKQQIPTLDSKTQFNVINQLIFQSDTGTCGNLVSSFCR